MSSQPFQPLPAAEQALEAQVSRRTWLASGVAAIGGVLCAASFGRSLGHRSAQVAIVKAEHYDDRLVEIVQRGLAELGLGRAWVRGKTVLLKPNLVEPSRSAPHVNTHPALVRAVLEVFRRWDAREVLVGEGQGHCRDTDLVLEQSGLQQVLDEAKADYIDLNYDNVEQVVNPTRYSTLETLWLPSSVRRADIIVSLPKLKTHHWAGVTLSMKNLFGVMPGICYGWPKNVLHFAGIDQSILDINAAVKPHLAIIDGIVGMEGDGPIMGTPKAANVLVMGTNFPAVDATAARLMGFDPHRIAYLANAGSLGPIEEHAIQQRGEPLAAVSQTFALGSHPSLRVFRL